MPQNSINSPTDDVSALTAEAGYHHRRVLEEKERAEAAEREGRRLAEWLNAIRLEIEARGTNANMETVLHYAQEALSGKDPHWMTDDYLSRARDPRRKA